VAEVEIRLLKARTEAAESCLKIILNSNSIKKSNEFEDFYFPYNPWITLNPNSLLPFQTSMLARKQMQKMYEKGKIQKINKIDDEINKLKSMIDDLGVDYCNIGQRLLC
jgi:hypothetical protein